MDSASSSSCRRTDDKNEIMYTYTDDCWLPDMACMRAVDEYFLGQKSNVRLLYDMFASVLDRAKDGEVTNFVVVDPDSGGDTSWPMCHFYFSGRLVEMSLHGPRYARDKLDYTSRVTLWPAETTWELVDTANWSHSFFGPTEEEVEREKKWTEAYAKRIRGDVGSQALLEWLRQRV